MTEWTAEEERVAQSIADMAAEWYYGFGRNHIPASIIAKRLSRFQQPRWRDVRTDPPPLGIPVLTCRAGEGGINMCARLLDGEWVEQVSGRTTVTHHSFAAPTHWQHPPLPPAPGDTIMNIEPTQAQIERAALAIAKLYYAGHPEVAETSWHLWTAEAEAALIAALNPPPEPDDAPTDRASMEPWPYTGAAPGRAGDGR